jgi:hypothetical protein
MHEQRGELAAGGSGSDAASHLPAVTLGQAAAAVWVVVVHLDTAGGGLSDLLGQVLEVLVGGDLAARDSCETFGN